MDMPIELIGVGGPRFRLENGLTVLELWADSAGQAQKNVVYKALFAVTDGSVFRRYVVFSDFRSGEFSVMVKEDLVIRFVIQGLDAFGISYIGAVGSASELDLGIDPAA